MDIPYGEIGGEFFKEFLIGDVVKIQSHTASLVGGASDYAYIFEASGYFSHRAIQRLMDSGIILRVLEQPYTSDRLSFQRGSILIPVGVQREKGDQILDIIESINKFDGVNVHAIETGYASAGIDLGSPSMTTLAEPKIAVLVEGKVNGYEAGEVWHVLDHRVGAKVTKLPIGSVASLDLSRYNRIVMPNGRYDVINKNGVKKLDEWIKVGGIIIAWKDAGNWLASSGIASLEFKEKTTDSSGLQAYGEMSRAKGTKVTGGAIFEAQRDLTHPLAYGLSRTKLTLFRNHNNVLRTSTDGYSHPIVYSQNPLLSGYVHKKNLDRIKGAPAAQVISKGNGKVIYLSDNPNFRAFWYGTNKLFFNALYFGDVIK